MTAGTVQAAHPPEALMRHLVNPVMRTLLRSPLARWTGPLVLLEVVGRRSGRRLRIPVVGHWVDGVLHVSTDGRWTANFQGGATLHVVQHGHRWAARGVLLEDPQATVAALRAAMGTSSPRSMGLGGVPAGHEITAEEWLRLRRVVRITAEGSEAPGRSAPAS
jgi:hypothetical protein